MKTLFMGMTLISLNTWCFGDERPTIDSLIGKRIHIEDAFAGQSFTLLKGRKGKQEYIVEWIRSGTGVPSIRSHKCKVRVISNYQLRFILDHPKRSMESSPSPLPAKTKSRFSSMESGFILMGLVMHVV